MHNHTKLLFQAALLTLFSTLLSKECNGQEFSINGLPVNGFTVTKNEHDWTCSYEQKFNNKSDAVWSQLELNTSGWKQHPEYPYIHGYNGNITLKIVAPGPIMELSAQARITNHADGQIRKAVISYSTNGVDFKSIAEKDFGDIVIKGSTEVPTNQDILWLRFSRILKENDANGSHGFVVFKSISFRITGSNAAKDKQDKENEKKITAVPPVNSEYNKFNGYPEGSIVLVDKDKVALTIVIPDTPLSLYPVMGLRRAITQEQVGDILQRYLNKASGAKITIVSAKNAPEKGNLILLGESSLTRKYGLTTPDKYGAFSIKSFPRGVAILGNMTKDKDSYIDTGLMPAIYSFLEDYVGYFFVINGRKSRKIKLSEDICMVSPKPGSILIPGNIDINRIPAFSHRISHGIGEDVFRAGIFHDFAPNHSHGPGAWARLYEKTNPDYFLTKADGTKDYRFLCFSNSEVLKRDVENIEYFYKTGIWRNGGYAPSGKYIRYEPADNQPLCQCERCKKMQQPKKGSWGSNSNLHWDYVNRLAREIKKRWPDKRLSTLAYQSHIDPPDFDLEDNVDVMVCMLPCPTTIGSFCFGKSKMDANTEMIRRLKLWSSKLGGDKKRLFIWDYFCYPGFWTAAPTINPHSLQTFVQKANPLINGVFIDGSGSAPLQESHLITLVWSRLLWDPNMDVDAFIKTYCERYFGPAGKPMKQFYDICIDRYENVPVNKNLWTIDSYISPQQMYGEIYTPEVTEQLEKVLGDAKQAVMGLNKDNPYRKRVLWMIDGLTNYVPTNGMYVDQEGFIAEAKQAYKWLGRTPAYTIAKTSKAPIDLSNYSIWTNVPETELVYGAEHPSYSLETYGFPADVKTKVKMLHDDTNIYFLINIEEPEMDSASNQKYQVKEQVLDAHIGKTQKAKTFKGDTFKLELLQGKAKMKVLFRLTCTPMGKILESTSKKVNIKSRQKRNSYELLISVPQTEISSSGAKQFLAQFYRTRLPRKENMVVRHYIWSPKLGPQWGDFPWNRYGRVTLQK